MPDPDGDHRTTTGITPGSRRRRTARGSIVGMELRLRDRYPVGEQVAADPVVLVVDDFLSPEERGHLIGRAAGRLGDALVSAVGPARTSAGRTGSVAWVNHDETPPVRRVVDRVSSLIGIPGCHAESLQLIHYREAERYRPHYDAYDLETERGRQRTARGGQRLVTALAYLNEVTDGGGTTFPRLDVTIEPRPGRLVVFHNVADHTLRDLTRHPASLHGGDPVRRGEKWAFNLWFRARPYRAATGSGSDGRRR
jgi:prolyl 4-hydroxylase